MLILVVLMAFAMPAWGMVHLWDECAWALVTQGQQGEPDEIARRSAYVRYINANLTRTAAIQRALQISQEKYQETFAEALKRLDRDDPKTPITARRESNKAVKAYLEGLPQEISDALFELGAGREMTPQLLS